MKIEMTNKAPRKAGQNTVKNNELETTLLTLAQPNSKPYAVISAISKKEAERIAQSICYYRTKNGLGDVINYRTITNHQGKRNIVLWNKTRTDHPYH